MPGAGFYFGERERKSTREDAGFSILENKMHFYFRKLPGSGNLSFSILENEEVRALFYFGKQEQLFYFGKRGSESTILFWKTRAAFLFWKTRAAFLFWKTRK